MTIDIRKIIEDHEEYEYLNDEKVCLDDFDREIFLKINNTKVDYPTSKTVHKLFEEQVATSLDSPALVFRNEQITYQELNNKADKLAEILKKILIKQNSIVGIMLGRSFEMVIAMLAVLKAGGAFLPIDPEYPQNRINYMLEDSNTKLVLTQGILEKKIKYSGDIINLDNLEIRHYEKVLAQNNMPKADDLAYIIYTSGSSGEPKGVMIEHRSVVNFFKGITDIIDFSVGKAILAITTISFDIFILEILLSLTRGLKVVIADENQQKNPKLLSEVILSNKIDMLQMTPSRLQLLLMHTKGLGCLANLKEIMIGGEPINLTLLERIKNETNAKIYNMYGPTETTVWSTVSNLTDIEGVNIGKPIANTQIYILNDNNCLQPIGAEGELYIGGDGLARGYINKPDLSETKFVANPYIPGQRMYRTGDLARYLPDGNIECLGRVDSQLKIRGYRIEPEEIESQLLKLNQIKEAVVVAKESKDSGKYLCAYVVMDDELVIEGLREFLSRDLPDYMIPSQFIRLEELVYTPNGKIDRKSLMNYEAVIKKDEVLKDRTNESEIILKLKGIIDENIPILDNQLVVNSSLESIGVNSITFIKLVVSIETEFCIEFDDEYLDASKFENIRSLAHYIQSKLNL